MDFPPNHHGHFTQPGHAHDQANSAQAADLQTGVVRVAQAFVESLEGPEELRGIVGDQGQSTRIRAVGQASPEDPARMLAMQVTLDLPDDISAALEGHWADVPRQALEALAVDAYRTGALTEGQVRRLLQLQTRLEVHALLKHHGVPLRYTQVDLEDDLAAHREWGILRD